MTTKLHRIMTPKEAKSIIASKITSLDWRITSPHLVSGAGSKFSVESRSVRPPLEGWIFLNNHVFGEGFSASVNITCSGVSVFASEDNSITSFFLSLMDSHIQNETIRHNNIIIEIAKALQSL